MENEEMTEKDSKKKKILLLMGIMVMVIMIAGTAYAFFANRNSATLDIDVKTATSTLLTFTTDDTINITASFDNFGKNTGNQYDIGTARAHLVKGDDEEASTVNADYYVYLLIQKNELEYTSFSAADGKIYMAPLNEDEKLLKLTPKPELILTIKDPAGKIVGSTDSGTKSDYTIDGLTFYKDITTNDGTKISGYDITESEGLLKIAEKRNISTTSKKTEEWQVTVTLINLGTNQTRNTRKEFQGGIILQNVPMTAGDTIIELHNKQLEDYTIYYLDSAVDYTGQQNSSYETNDKSYRYSGPNYKVKEEFNTLYTSVDSGTTGVIRLNCNSSETSIQSGCTSATKYYHLAYDSNNKQYETYWEAAAQAVKDGYLEENVKNYVCFGSDADVCPEENLYRIIGAFDEDKNEEYQLKIIKADYATKESLGEGTAYSSSTYSDSDYAYYQGKQDKEVLGKYTFGTSGVWSESTVLQTENLNTNFYKTFSDHPEMEEQEDSKWQQMIDEHSWKVGIASSDSYTPKDMFTYETNSTPVTAKIGLMYASDYGFATTPTYWATTLNGFSSSSIKQNNWLYLGLTELTITNYSSSTNLVVLSTGDVDTNSSNNAVRPAFYLQPSVRIASGSGKLEDPYRLKMVEAV